MLYITKEIFIEKNERKYVRQSVLERGVHSIVVQGGKKGTNVFK